MFGYRGTIVTQRAPIIKNNFSRCNQNLDMDSVCMYVLARFDLPQKNWGVETWSKYI